MRGMKKRQARQDPLLAELIEVGHSLWGVPDCLRCGAQETCII